MKKIRLIGGIIYGRLLIENKAGYGGIVCGVNEMKDIQKAIKKYIGERGWDTQRPSDVAKSVAIEAAELLELFQWVSLTINQTKKDKKLMDELKSEVADVLIYAIDFGVLLGFDVKKVVLNKLEYQSKKYPAKLVKSKKHKGSSVNDEYWRIKEDHRAKKKLT